MYNLNLHAGVNRLDLANVALSMDSRAHLLEGTARPQCAQAEHVERFCGLSLGSAALSVETGEHALAGYGRRRMRVT